MPILVASRKFKSSREFWRGRTDSGRVVEMMMCVLYFIRAINDNDVLLVHLNVCPSEHSIGSHPKPITVAGQAARRWKDRKGDRMEVVTIRNSIYSCRNFKRQFLAQICTITTRTKRICTAFFDVSTPAAALPQIHWQSFENKDL